MRVRTNIGTTRLALPQDNSSLKNNNMTTEPAALEAKLMIADRHRLTRNDTGLIHHRRRSASMKIITAVIIRAGMAVSGVKRLMSGLMASARQISGKKNMTNRLVNSTIIKNCKALYFFIFEKKYGHMSPFSYVRFCSSIFSV